MTAPHPPTPAVSHPFPCPPSLTSLTLCLAYIAYYNPVPPRPGHLLRRGDARRLAAWLGATPIPNRPHHTPAVALHLVWLVAAGLLRHDRAGLHLSPTALFHLHEPAPRLLAALLAAATSPAWDEAAAQLGLAGAVPPTYRLFAHQAMARRAELTPPSLPLAVWESFAGDAWHLRLRPNDDPGRLFELLALGPYQPDGGLTLSPVSLGAPPARHLGYDRLRWLLETATDAPLTTAQQEQLRHWLSRAAAYRLRGPLLITARPEQLAALYATRRLRPYLVEQIGPRCALFNHAGLVPLRRRLAALGYPLDAAPSAAAPPPPDTTALWLGLRLLAGLPHIAGLPGALPGALPHRALDHLAATLPGDDLAVLEAQADRLLADLHAVIQGRDAFLPARHDPPAELLARLHEALAGEETLTLDYCPPGGAEPRRHTVEPLRLEQRGRLTYLVAYSYRAEATLTLRLDRLHLILPTFAGANS